MVPARSPRQRQAPDVLELDDVPLFTVSDDTFARGTLGLLMGSKGRLALPADDFSAIVD